MNDDHAMFINRFIGHGGFKALLNLGIARSIARMRTCIKVLHQLRGQADHHRNPVASISCNLLQRCPFVPFWLIKHLNRKSGAHARASEANDSTSLILISLLRLRPFFSAVLSSAEITFFGILTTTGKTVADSCFFRVFTFLLRVATVAIQ